MIKKVTNNQSIEINSRHNKMLQQPIKKSTQATVTLGTVLIENKRTKETFVLEIFKLSNSF